MTIPQSPGRKLKPHITRHTLEIMHPLGHTLSQADRQSLAELPGIDFIIYDPESGHLDITYDLNQIHLDDIETHLMDEGYLCKEDLINHLRHAMAHFLERSELGAFYP
jgi:hypothetical protein